MENKNMIAVYSSTFDPKYDFFLPITSYCWNKLGVNSIIFIPMSMRLEKRFNLVLRACHNALFYVFDCPKDKEATYAQLSRLYAASIESFNDAESFIVSDADMAFFGKHIIYNCQRGWIDVYGADLVPENQLPMCYQVGYAETWLGLMQINGRSFQQCLDDALGHEEMENMRGCLWARDQETAHKFLYANSIPHDRARPGTQFASHRCDRDDTNWRSYLGSDLVDAHLWRPGYTDENFTNILELLQTQYPEDSFQWLIDYRNEYIKLL